MGVQKELAPLEDFLDSTQEWRKTVRSTDNRKSLFGTVGNRRFIAFLAQNEDELRGKMKRDREIKNASLSNAVFAGQGDTNKELLTRLNRLITVTESNVVANKVSAKANKLISEKGPVKTGAGRSTTYK